MVNFLREKGFLSTIYLDDLLCISNDNSSCLKNVKTTRNILNKLGFTINEEKSSHTPSNRCKYLGFVINTIEMTLSLPTDKRILLVENVREFLHKESCQIRNFARLIGLLVAACPAVPYGILYTKLLEREKFLALILSDNDFDQKMVIPSYLQEDLRWWLSVILFVKNPIRHSKFKKEIFSDASLSGWGAHCNRENVHGFWTSSERRLHINHLELIAAFRALKCFTQDCENCEILLRIDNTTAIAYINRMGGVQFPELNRLARNIWKWCEEKNIWVFASYIPSRENSDADRESRRQNIDTEWELANFAFNKIIRKWGSLDIDLFATSINAKVQKFCSWKRDPEAWNIDAFTVNWEHFYFYAFPPFSLLARVLQKIRIDKALGILVVPLWSTQPWFPLFNSMLIDRPLVFLPSPDLLLSPCRSRTHPMTKRLTLVAGKLSGDPSNRNHFQRIQ